MKRPLFIIFTDKDGTINVKDKQLNHIFHLITTMGGMIVPITGRTVGDIEDDLKKQDIRPEFIIGDNGAVIYSTRKHEFLMKKQLDKERVTLIVKDFVDKGGNQEFIRYTDGLNIYAAKQGEVKKYYKKNKRIILCDDICQQVQETEDITKITLAGSLENIKQSAEFAKSLGYWTDRDVTEFPVKHYQNYRLDIAQKDINKGQAVKRMAKILNPTYGYVCLGNGFNDLSMFKTAIDDGMIAAIMKNSSPELIQEIKTYSQSKKGRVMLIPKDKDLANKYILKMAKLFETHIKTQERKRRQREGRLPNVPRLKVNGGKPTKVEDNDFFKRENRYH